MGVYIEILCKIPVPECKEVADVTRTQYCSQRGCNLGNDNGYFGCKATILNSLEMNLNVGVVFRVGG